MFSEVAVVVVVVVVVVEVPARNDIFTAIGVCILRCMRSRSVGPQH